MTGPLQVPFMRATGEVAIGAAPAVSGAIRLSNSQWIASRNAAGSADVNIVRVNASDQVELGAGMVTPGPVAVGTNPAQSGVIRIPNNQWVTSRNAANDADINVIRVNTSNRVELGADTVVQGSISVGSNAAQSGIVRLPNNQWITARNAANSGDVNVMRLNLANRVEVGVPLVVGYNVLETADPPVNSAAVLLLVNLGSNIITTRRIEIGAADSGGPGYRVLRVLN
ncbi:MAG: hypothetical protein NZ902_06525 [Acidilobaceae archaeon]|nr:hypothetical protein [Acidilobaceae archaeon]